MGLKKDVLFAAAMAMVGMTDYRVLDKEEFIPVFCGDCKFFPDGKKTFCKLAGHKVCKTSPAHKCEHYYNKNIVED